MRRVEACYKRRVRVKFAFLSGSVGLVGGGSTGSDGTGQRVDPHPTSILQSAVLFRSHPLSAK